MISAVIPTKDDPLLLQTVQSLRNKCDEVIIVNDGGSTPDHDLLEAHPNLTILDNVNRIGPGPSRDLGVRQLKNPEWILLCDSHMVFPEHWYSFAYEHLKHSHEMTLWGTVWHMDIIENSMWHDTNLIGGADTYFWRHDPRRAVFSFMDTSPRRVQHNMWYDVPCVLGGCYFIHAELWDRIGGMPYFVGYGSEETYLSWSTWLLGGYVRIMGNLPVTHVHQTVTRSRKPLIPEWEVNRMITLKRILTPDEFANYCSWLPIGDNIKQIVGNHEYHFDRLRDKDVLSHQHVTYAFGLQTIEAALDQMAIFHQQTHSKI